MDECKAILEAIRLENKRTTNLLMLLCELAGIEQTKILQAIDV